VDGAGKDWVCLWCLALTQMCDTCGKGDREEWLLLCSSPGCRGACHTFCHTPMMHHVPESDWFCIQCCRVLSSGSRESKKQKRAIEGQDRRRLSTAQVHSPTVEVAKVKLQGPIEHRPSAIDMNQLIGLLKRSCGFPFRYRLQVATNNAILDEALLFGCGFNSVIDAQLYSTAMLQASFGFPITESSRLGL
jgi:hypothetical protein